MPRGAQGRGDTTDGHSVDHAQITRHFRPEPGRSGQPRAGSSDHSEVFAPDADAGQAHRWRRTRTYRIVGHHPSGTWTSLRTAGSAWDALGAALMAPGVGVPVGPAFEDGLIDGGSLFRHGQIEGVEEAERVEIGAREAWLGHVEVFRVECVRTSTIRKSSTPIRGATRPILPCLRLRTQMRTATLYAVGMETESLKDDLEPEDLLSLLWKADVTRALKEDPKAFSQLNDTKPIAFSRSLRGVYRRIFDQMSKDPSIASLQESYELLCGFEEVFTTPHVRFLRATLDILEAMRSAGLSNAIATGDSTTLVEAAEARVTGKRTKFESREARLAVSNLLGKAYSLNSRDAAAEQFESLRRADSRGLIEHFYLDAGAKTYFSSNQLSSNASHDASTVRHSIQSIDANRPSASHGVLIAADEKFYRVYGPLLYFFAQQCPEVDVCLLLCGPEGEVESLVGDGTRYAEALNGFNRSGYPRNVHHFQVPVPSFVREHLTFYATARFFAAEMMLERYQSVYLMDADLTTNVDPMPYFRRVAELRFAAPRMTGFVAMHPWRRYMAGNIALNRGVIDTPVLSDIQKYIAHGLKHEFSWTLDQNSLAYAIERNPYQFTDLAPFGRPFSQPKFRLHWEKRYSM